MCSCIKKVQDELVHTDPVDKVSALFDTAFFTPSGLFLFGLVPGFWGRGCREADLGQFRQVVSTFPCELAVFPKESR